MPEREKRAPDMVIIESKHFCFDTVILLGKIFVSLDGKSWVVFSTKGFLIL